MKGRIKSCAQWPTRLSVLALLWLGGVVGAFAYLAVYSYTPGAIGTPPAADSNIAPAVLRDGFADGNHHLVMAIHPRCPCTRTSLGELGNILRRSDDHLRCTILCYRPQDAAADWQEGATFAAAEDLPNSRLVMDEEGHLANQLQLQTSGAVVLYSPEGSPVYSGGVTLSRGHEGENPGSEAVLSLVLTGTGDRSFYPVYGCPIVHTTVPLQE